MYFKLLSKMHSYVNYPKVQMKHFIYDSSDVVSGSASWFGTSAAEMENITFNKYFRLGVVGVQPDVAANKSIHEDDSDCLLSVYCSA